MIKRTVGKWVRSGMDIRSDTGKLIAILQTSGCYKQAIADGDYIVEQVNKEQPKCENLKKKRKK